MIDQTVIGIDVGGVSKGFHGVALRGREILELIQSCDITEIYEWCRGHHAIAVGVDAPCRWRTDAARAAESALARERIYSFSTPRAETARIKPFYGWMLRGAALYLALEPEYPLFCGQPRGARSCLETFPHAVICALMRQVVPAKQKSTRRRAILEQQGIRTHRLRNIDYIDAALCAVAAQYLHRGSFKAYGDAASGYIVVPQRIN